MPEGSTRNFLGPKVTSSVTVLSYFAGYLDGDLVGHLLVHLVCPLPGHFLCHQNGIIITLKKTLEVTNYLESHFWDP